MQETAQQYTQRILGYVAGKNAFKVQSETPKRLAALIKTLHRRNCESVPRRTSGR